MKLLLLLLPLTWSETTSGAESGSEVTGKTIKENKDVLLDCALNGRNIKDEVFEWKKDGSTEVFMYKGGIHDLNDDLDQDLLLKDRVSFFPEQLAVGNASIVIRKAQVKDSGTYICIFPRRKPMTRAQFELTVGASPKPYITHKKTTEGVLLQCEVEGAFPKPRLEWLNSSGNILPAEPTFTQKDISFYVFLQTTVTKSGDYRCVATQEKIHSQVYSETYVSVTGAASEPYITILDQTTDFALLQCVVKGVSPQPDIFWTDDSGYIVDSEEPEVTERGGSYDVVLQTTVTKTDYYHCVVIQDDINHEVSAKVKVFVAGFSITWVVTAAVLGAVVGVVVFFLLQNVWRKKRSHRRRSLNSVQLPDQPLKETLTE